MLLAGRCGSLLILPLYIYNVHSGFISETAFGFYGIGILQQKAQFDKLPFIKSLLIVRYKYNKL